VRFIVEAAFHITVYRKRGLRGGWLASYHESLRFSRTSAAPGSHRIGERGYVPSGERGFL
jgi:hypothetical protein